MQFGQCIHYTGVYLSTPLGPFKKTDSFPNCAKSRQLQSSAHIFGRVHIDARFVKAHCGKEYGSALLTNGVKAST